jgi:tripartite ATP-independent transporter DctM subunit
VANDVPATGQISEISPWTKVIRVLDKVGEISRWMNIIGLATLFGMIILTFVDVILRYFFSRPIMGVTEVTEVMTITAVFLAVAYTYKEKGHVTVDLISSKLASKSRAILIFIMTFLSLYLLVIIVWQTALYAQRAIELNMPHANLLPIPKAPFALIITFGNLILGLLIIRDLLIMIVEAKRLGLRWYHWLTMLAVPILIIVLASLWMQPTIWHVNSYTVGLIAIIVFLVLLLCGMPVAFALIMTSFVFIGQLRGSFTALDQVGTEFYRVTGSYQWVPVAFFTIMGFFCLHTKFGEDLYYAASKWVGHLRGGLSIATVGACAGFAAIVGDSVAATATMGAVALPETRKYGYNDLLSTGSIMGGALLGPIIPPSVPFVVYGILTGVSIGTLFIAGIIPGLILSLLFIAMIYVWCRLKPDLAVSSKKSAWKPRLISLKAIGPVIILFLLCVGGIYTGIFSPSEGGAVGTVGAVIMGLVWRRITWKNFGKSLQDSGKVISMVFLIIIGGTLFSRLAAWSDFGNALKEFASGIPVYSLIIFILFIYFVLGCVIDILPLVLIGVPILHPLVVAQGIDPIWFAILINLVIILGSLTPPVGLILFVLKGMYKDIPMNTIYFASLPFVAVTVLLLVLLYFVPSLITWLPNVLK